MTLRLNGSSSGFTEINAPAAAGSNTLVLPTSNGSANQVLKNGSTAGTLEFAAIDRVKRTYSAEASITSGDTEVEFTGIPANFSRLMLVFHDISFSGSDQLLVQVGHAGSGGTYFTSSYLSYRGSMGTSAVSGSGSLTTGFAAFLGSAVQSLFGVMEIIPDKASSPTRLYQNHMSIRQDGSALRLGAGYSPDISAVTIDRIKMRPSGSNTFDDTDGRVSLITEVIE
jgi:hypothetical protein